jgi:excisionase family DNA binding protein
VCQSVPENSNTCGRTPLCHIVTDSQPACYAGNLFFSGERQHNRSYGCRLRLLVWKPAAVIHASIETGGFLANLCKDQPMPRTHGVSETGSSRRKAPLATPSQATGALEAGAAGSTTRGQHVKRAERPRPTEVAEPPTSTSTTPAERPPVAGDPEMTYRRIGTSPTTMLLTFKEAMDFLRVSRSTIYRLMWSGQLRGHKVGSTWRFYEADLLAAVAVPAYTVEPAPARTTREREG